MRFLGSIVASSLFFVVSVSGAPHELLSKRQASDTEQAAIVQLAKTNPVAAAKKILHIKNVDHYKPSWAKYNNISGNADAEQVPWAPSGVEFQTSPDVSLVGGDSFSDVPSSFYMFKTNYVSVKGSNGKAATQPFYINKDLSNVKRAVLVWPGYYRDSWNYINMVGNAFNIAKKLYDIDEGSVAIAAPYVLNQNDNANGAVRSDWVYYKNDNWCVAGVSHGPKHVSVSSFSAMDTLVEELAETYPGIEKFVIVGHSLGAQAVLRYAMLTESKHADQMAFWSGNPGTYTYLTSDRPLSHDDCDDYDTFPSGLGSGIPSYSSSGKSALAKQFLSRNVRIAQGLNDNGVSSEMCDTMAQGHDRLDRSAYYVEHLSQVNGGSFPDSFSMEYVEGVSHQNYPMFATKDSLSYIFIE
ncbi:Uncharacterized protein MSYG_3519 [Malassezia sympodialis ATCC 42132]|uniref:Uncharacterized protein n=1 Tax=Malassezia sympodialis (strain ATCC 42132) TaxID=1230383 RepID=A0A1M8A9P4_MALS4|nr:Uncharacterized protein MSYG_3519 [Malassezia sympodialis ATCC 42132]